MSFFFRPGDFAYRPLTSDLIHHRPWFSVVFISVLVIFFLLFQGLIPTHLHPVINTPAIVSPTNSFFMFSPFFKILSSVDCLIQRTPIMLLEEPIQPVKLLVFEVVYQVCAAYKRLISICWGGGAKRIPRGV